MFFRRNALFVALLFLLASCAGSGVLNKEAIQKIGNKNKRDIRCYVINKRETVLETAIMEGCRQVFEVVNSRPYDIKVVSEIKDYHCKVLNEKCKYEKSYGGVTCEGQYSVRLWASVIVYDAGNEMIKRIEKPYEKTVATFGMSSGRKNNKEVASYRSQRNAAGEANSAIMNRILPDIINKIYFDDNIIALEKQICQNSHSTVMARTREQKIPFCCVLSLPIDFEEIKARANFQRSLNINYEKQAGTTEVNIGHNLKKAFVEKLEKEFSEVQIIGIEEGAFSATYNPHNVTCIVKIDYQDTIVESEPDSRVTIEAKAKLCAPTGEIYKTLDLTGEGLVKLGSGGSFLSEVVAGVSITRAIAEGLLIKQALKNGCAEAIKEISEKLVASFNPDFTKKFSEYAAYVAALRSKSLNDIKHFLTIYPQSQYAAELYSLMDDIMYEFAIGTDSIEGYMDYLDQIPQGAYQNKSTQRLEVLIMDQIDHGNTYFCEIYFKYIPNGEHLDEITKACKDNRP